MIKETGNNLVDMTMFILGTFPGYIMGSDNPVDTIMKIAIDLREKVEALEAEKKDTDLAGLAVFIAETFPKYIELPDDLGEIDTAIEIMVDLQKKVETLKKKNKKLEEKGEKTTERTLDNTNVDEAKNKMSDLVVFGDGDLFKLICKASSKSEGWMKSTKAMQINDVGCVVQVTTQQGDNVAEALVFVPGVRIEGEGEQRCLVALFDH